MNLALTRGRRRGQVKNTEILVDVVCMIHAPVKGSMLIIDT